jgi:hypothetical protein
MDRLDQLRARSRHEIEAHAGDFDNTDTGRYFIDEALELLAGMRMVVAEPVPNRPGRRRDS